MNNSCPVCRSINTSSKTITGLCAVTTCSCCYHEYTQLDDILIKEDYNLDYFENVHKNWFENPQIKLFKLITSIILNNFNKKRLRILDVGCGRGALLSYLKNKILESDLYGIDLSEPPANIESSIKIIQSSLSDFHENIIYDIIISTMVIEHIEDVNEFLIKIKSLLKNDGLLIIATNDTHTPLYYMAKILYRIGITSPYQRLYHPHHLNHFGRNNLRKLAENNGFKSYFCKGQNVSLSSLDIPASSKLQENIYRMGVKFLFLIGSLIGHPFLQIQTFKIKS